MTKLVIVTLLLAALALVLRRRTGPAARLHAIKVTGRASMHRGVTVAVVEVDGRRLLVGAGAQSVNLIADLGDAEETADAATTAAVTTPSVGTPLVGTPLAHPPLLDTSVVSGSVLFDSSDPVEAGPVSLVEKLRRATTRTADPVMRSALVRSRRPGALR